MRKLICFLFAILTFVACHRDKTLLEDALSQAGRNRPELEKVLEHYQNDPEKLAAARFLIINMSEHYSYSSDKIHTFYEQAMKVISSDLSIDEQIDSLANIKKNDIGNLKTVSDIYLITADYLIYSIDNAFNQWKERQWAQHLTFDEFCEWLLPYKVVECQEFDYWRDSLPQMFADTLLKITGVNEGVMYNTIYRVEDIVRNEMLQKIPRNGLYRDGGYPLLSVSTMARMTFGHCADYINLIVATYRSVGIPVVIDRTPYYGRFRAGHTWHTVLTDRGWQLPSAWDLATVPGHKFFPYERFPKVYRHTFAINQKRMEFQKDAKYPYPLPLCEVDVTDKYTRTSDISVALKPNCILNDKYCYIAVFNGHDEIWSVVDYGTTDGVTANFTNIGRNVLYIVLSFDRRGLRTISNPFILHPDGSIEYILSDKEKLRNIIIRRKYYESANVVDKRRRILGAKIQCANLPDFSDAITLHTIETTSIPDKLALPTEYKRRYWRYFAADETYGSIAELAFFDSDKQQLSGKPIACEWANSAAIKNAFDDGWLTNFETSEPNGNWVGMDMEHPINVSFVRIVPRSDDNDVCPGNEYELRYWDGDRWVSTGRKTANDNSLLFDSIPSGTLLWLKNYTRGWDERPFRIDSVGNIEWR
ncbi:MAG: hypothetical protein J6Y82_09660 [Bacteroidales bacterium]|nr:hypothetical protein [Bacteroidales bacterium]